MGLLLAMYGNKVSISEALFISVFAMIVVFVVLLIISYLIDISAFFINGSSKKKTEVKVDAKSDIVKANDKSENKKSDDVVVVIAAAIASFLGTSVDNVHIKSIRRIPQNDTPWTERGLISQIEKL